MTNRVINSKMNTDEILTKGKVRTMEEKVLVQGEIGDIKKIRNTILIVGMILVGIMGVVTFGFYSDYSQYISGDTSYAAYSVELQKQSAVIISGVITACLFVICILVASIVYNGLSKILLVVTDKRVYGKAMFGKQVDLPLDSISTLGMGAFSSIAVATSSGKITFWGISNRDEIHKAISGLLQNRQSGNTKEAAPVTHITQQVQSSADELKKYKDLLDSGVISQEEFDAKKKQLLGL